MMKKSTAAWIAVGAVASCLVAFSAGMSYALNQLKKIQTEDLAPTDEDTDTSEENTEA